MIKLAVDPFRPSSFAQLFTKPTMEGQLAQTREELAIVEDALRRVSTQDTKHIQQDRQVSSTKS